MNSIIGHRGARGLALENTIESFKKAIEVGVQCFEFDVQVTRDGVFVVCHDNSLARVSQSGEHITDLDYEALQNIPLNNGEPVPRLTEVLDLARAHEIAVIVELKTDRLIESLCEQLDKYQDLSVVVASFDHDTIASIRELRPEWRLYLTENHNPIEVLQKAHFMGVQGIDLNYKLMNPLTYFLAIFWKLEIMVYTVNSPAIKRALGLLYPRVAICTDYPDRFISHAKRQSE